MQRNLFNQKRKYVGSFRVYIKATQTRFGRNRNNMVNKILVCHNLKSLSQEYELFSLYNDIYKLLITFKRPVLRGESSRTEFMEPESSKINTVLNCESFCNLDEKNVLISCLLMISRKRSSLESGCDDCEEQGAEAVDADAGK